MVAGALAGASGQSVNVVINAVDNFSQTFARAQSSMGKLRGKLMGGAAAGAGAAIALKNIADAGIKMESAMVGVQKTTGMTDEKTAEFRDEIMGMAGDMPLATEKITEIAEIAGRLGIKGSENIKAFTDTTAQMAVSTDLSAGQAANAFARLSTLLDLPIKESEELGSAINALSNNMATSSKEIVNSMMRASGSMGQLGIKANEMVGLSATLNEVSESSERAGSRLRRLAQEMVEPKKQKKLAEVLGVTTEEFKTMVEEDPTKTIATMAKQMKEGGDKADRLNQIFSTTSRQAIAGLSQNLDGLKSSLGMTSSEFKNATSLQKEYDKVSESTESQIKMMSNKFNELKVGLAKALLPVIKNTLIPVLETVLGWFQSAPGWVKKAIVIIGGLTVAVGALSVAVLAFNAVSAPWLGIIAAIVAAVAGVVAIITHWGDIMDWIGDKLQAVWDAIKSAFNAGVDFIKKIFLNMTPIGLIMKHWEPIKEFFSNLWDSIKDIFAGIKDAIVDAFKSAFNFVADIWNGFISIWEEGINFILSGINKITSFASKIPGINVPEIGDLSLSALKIKPVDDFILTKERELIQPAKDDTIIGAKDFGNMGKSQTFNINIDKISGTDPDEMAEAFQRELKNRIGVA